MSAPLWALIGVAIGAILSGLTNFMLQRGRFRHEKDMFRLKNQSGEMVKSLLLEMLNHRSYTDRKFDALKKPIGGYSDDELRKFLHEINAKKVTRSDGEWWCLISREEERIKALRSRKAKKTKPEN